jgi:hypothetical protein
MTHVDNKLRKVPSYHRIDAQPVVTEYWWGVVPRK